MAQISALITVPFAIILCVVFTITGDMNLLSFTIAWVQTFIIVYVALWFLSRRDTLRQKAAIARIRNVILSCPEVNDQEFLSASFEEPKFLLEMRDSVARVFNVPPAQISRTTPLFAEVLANHLDLWLVFSLLSSTVQSRVLPKAPVRILPTDIATIDDLARWFYIYYIGGAPHDR